MIDELTSLPCLRLSGVIVSVRHRFWLSTVESLHIRRFVSLSHELLSFFLFSSSLLISFSQLRTMGRGSFSIVSEHSPPSLLSMLHSGGHKLRTGVASSQFNLSVKDSPVFKPFALTKLFQPSPKVILPLLSRRRFASHFEPSLPNRYIFPGLFMPFSLVNCIGRRCRGLNKRQNRQE